MPMTQEELLERLDVAVKALTTTDLGSSKLTAEIADKYIRTAIDKSKLIRECRVLDMKADTRNIDRVAFADRILQAATEATAPGSTSKPAFAQRTLVAKEVIAAVDVSYSTLEDNIEEGSFEDTLIDMIGERASADLEELYLYAHPAAEDGSGGADDYLRLPAKRGWLRMTNALDGVNVVSYADAAPAKVSDVFQAMLEAVPSKYFGDLSQWRMYCSFKAERRYREELAERATSAGDRALLEDVPVFYQGIPVLWIPKIKGHAAGGTEDDRADAGNVYEFLFAHPANLVAGFKRDVTMETERKPRARTVEFTLTSRTDMNSEEPEAIAIADRVLVS